MKPIVAIPHPALSQPAKAVTVFDDKLRTLVLEMKTALKNARNPKGVGLAAPQIGVSLAIFVIRAKESDPIREFINPEITAMRDVDEHPEKKEQLEGCLSIPDVWGYVKRAGKLTLAYQDLTGAHHTEEFTGFPAIIVQHEADHLKGVLFTRRVIEQDGRLFEPKKDSKGKTYLDEITI